MINIVQISGVQFISFSYEEKTSKSTLGHTVQLHLDSGPPLIDASVAPCRIANAVDSDGMFWQVFILFLFCMPFDNFF